MLTRKGVKYCAGWQFQFYQMLLLGRSLKSQVVTVEYEVFHCSFQSFDSFYW